MSLFEFLMVFVSIIVGLGVTEVLSGIAMRIRHRESVRGYWLHNCGVALVFIALIQNWWELWRHHDQPEWTFLSLVFLLIAPGSLYLIAHLIFPEPMRGADVRKYYYGQMRPIWWLAVLTAVSAVLFGPIAFGTDLLHMDNVSTAVMLVGFTVLALSRNELVHSILIPVFLLLLLWDILRWTPVFTPA